MLQIEIDEVRETIDALIHPVPTTRQRWRLNTNDFSTYDLIHIYRWGGRIRLDDHTSINGVLVEVRQDGRDKPNLYTVTKYFATHHPKKEQWKEWRRELNDYILILRLSKGRLKAREILNCKNTTIRSLLMQRFGFDKFMKEAGTKVIDANNGRKLLMVPGTAPIVAVEVRDSTTGRNYILSVPPNIKNCEEAVAWTFGLEKEQYKPIKET